MMQLREFEHALDLHGSTMETWPQALRSAALALVETDDGARRLLSQARLLDSLFPATGAPPPPATESIVALAMSRPAPTRSPGFGQVLAGLFDLGWMRPAMLAGCVLAGFIVGTVDYAPVKEHDDILNLVDGRGLGAELADE